MKYLSIILSLFFVPTIFADTMCEVGSKPIFSCELKTKSVSACLNKSGNVSYLYGKKEKPEIKLNSPLLSTSSCSGGGISRLRFTNGEYSYILYDKLCNGEKIAQNQWSKIDVAGLYVLKDNEIIASKKCISYSENIFGVNTSLIPNIEREDFNQNIQ